MPWKNLEARRRYQREWARKKRADPEYRANRNEYDREYQRRRKAEDPGYYEKCRTQLAEWRSQHSDRVREMHKAWQERYREQCVQTKINGKLVAIYTKDKRARPDKCELCQRTLGLQLKALHYHHWNGSDFTKALWLCPRCHVLANILDKDPNLVPNYFYTKAQIETPKDVEEAANV